MARYDPEKMAVYRLARAHTRAIRELIDGARTAGFSDLGSTSECWGHTDNFVDFGLAPESGIVGIRDLQNQLIALLTTMIRNARADAAEA